jgi:hypothetical protein
MHGLFVCSCGTDVGGDAAFREMSRAMCPAISRAPLDAPRNAACRD